MPLPSHGHAGVPTCPKPNHVPEGIAAPHRPLPSITSANCKLRLLSVPTPFEPSARFA